jgi:zinc/manganese transport system substrate-binding protein
MNGAGYDHWMERLIDSSGGSGRKIVDVATLIGATEAGNPHLWYDPRAVPALAANLAEALSAIDPDGKDEYWSRSQDFFASLRELDEKIKTIRAGYAGTPVTATEPVFGLMARALGLDMRDTDFQRAIMNESEPSAHQLGELENDIRSHRVKVLFYNSQVVDPMTEHLLAVAGDARLPVVGVTEIMPEGADYVGWMLDQLEATEKALAAPSS